MTTLLQLFSLLVIISPFMVESNRLITNFNSRNRGYTGTSKRAPVCIKTWSIHVGEWLFLGEGAKVTNKCTTKWYINAEFGLCDVPGQCFSIKSADSQLYLSNNIGELSPILSESEVWNLLATPLQSRQGSFLLANDENAFLCSSITHELQFENDETLRFCHWNIDEIISIEPIDDKCATEHRHRKPWYTLNNEERELFISAVKTLNANGKLHTLVAVHANFTANVQYHGCAGFLPSHRYHLWEFENAVRNLGGKYKCFSLPYWDVTREALESRNPLDWYILNSGLGGNGNADDEYCVDDKIFGKSSEYEPYLHCVVDEDLKPINKYDTSRPQCCLKRNVCQEECVIYTPTDIIHSIAALPEYGSDEHQLISDPTLPPVQPLARRSAPINSGFQYDLEYKHGSMHGIIGGDQHLANLHFSPDEPIFWLMHNFIDYTWALWQDCHDYDLVAEQDINDEIYGGVLGVPDNIVQLHGPSKIDDELHLKELKETDWSYVSQNNIALTMRDMHNISRWKYSFEKGPFWKNARVDKFCPNINENWFYAETKEYLY